MQPKRQTSLNTQGCVALAEVENPQLSKNHSLNHHLVLLNASSFTAHPHSGFKTPLSFLSHAFPLSFHSTKVDELAVCNLAPPQHLALLPLSEDQPRMNSARDNVQRGREPGSWDRTTPPSGGDGLHSCPRPQNPAATVRRLALPSPPLHSWQGVFLFLFPLLLS